MATNINNLDNAMMTGANKFRRFQSKFQQRWSAPLIDAVISQAVRSADHGKLLELQSKYPDDFKFVMSRWGGGG